MRSHLLVVAAGAHAASRAADLLDDHAISRGLLPDGPADERVLLTFAPEPDGDARPPLAADPTVRRTLARYDRVLDLHDALGGTHPLRWAPRGPDLLVLGHLLRSLWDLGGAITLVAERGADGAPYGGIGLHRAFGGSRLVLLPAGSETPVGAL